MKKIAQKDFCFYVNFKDINDIEAYIILEVMYSFVK